VRLWIALACVSIAAPAEARRRGDDEVTVVAPQAELRGRPSMSATVTGLLRRGETALLVRRSADGRWLELDIGAGELAWIDARAVENGHVARPPRVRVARLDPPPEMHRIDRVDEDARAEPVVERPKTADVEIVRPAPSPLPPHGNDYFDVHVRLGAATPQHRIATNGVSSTMLPAYEYGATDLAVGAQLGYSRARGRLRVHLDLKYLIATLGAVRYADGTQLGLRDQNFGGGLAFGGFFPNAGGIDFRVRVGAEGWMTQIATSQAPLAIASEWILGMAAGVEFGMPRLFTLGGRPFGFRACGGGVAPATELQTTGLRTGAHATTYGAYAGGAIQMALLAQPRHGQVSLEARYDYAMLLTTYGGVCDVSGGCRDMSVSEGREAFVTHVATMGVYYQY
jgi:hypothetical protein